MKHRSLGIVGTALLVGTVLPWIVAETERSSASAEAIDKPYARIAVLRPHDGDTVDFEAGYIRHLEWHRQAKDTWVWYGWTVTFGERQRWFVYASFGHSAASLDNPVTAGGGRAGQHTQRHATRPVCGERTLRVPAGALARHG